MATPPSVESKPLQVALAEWAAAIKAVEADALRIAKGGPVDREATQALLTAVEVARLQCLFVSLQIGDDGAAH